MKAGYGTYDDEEAQDFMSSNMKQMRAGFIKKVYGILFAQLLITFSIVLIAMSTPEIGKFQRHNPIVLYICIGISIVIMLLLSCYTELCRSVPTNYILLFAFTLCEGYIVSSLCTKVNIRIVLMAAAMTCAITLALTCYACVTETDFTVFGGALFMASICLLLAGLFAMFTQNKIVHIVIASISVFVYSIYLIYDTQLILGRHENKLSCDDYIIGALMLYVDIIAIFMDLLVILGLTSNSS